MHDDDPFTLNEDSIFASFRDARLVAPRELLAAGGYGPGLPEAMLEEHLAGRMWELLYALAARRFFFCGAEALDDGALYAAVFAWLDRPQRDIPWDQGWNGLHDFMSGKETWSNPWFDEESHAAWRREVSCVVLPAATCEEQSARMLPVPPAPPVVLDNSAGGIPQEWLSGDADNDPLGLAPAAEPPPAIREPWEQPAAQLQRTGYTPVPPDELTDDTTAPLLWEFLHQLAIRNFFVTSTDHLSDSGLYRELWRKAIRDDALIPRRRTGTGYWMHDILGSYGDEEIQIQLAVYATDEERARHVREYPNILLPSRNERASRRDWRLPKPPF